MKPEYAHALLNPECHFLLATKGSMHIFSAQMRFETTDLYDPETSVHAVFSYLNKKKREKEEK